jgi:DNA mismatch repair protein MutL
MAIKLLSESVAAQIAAGEVVERPVSVVKELMENSLDAGARSVRIELEGGGRRLIRITDDGSGIPRDETELAFTRHATSKLNTADDLYNIHTLGFRGEALASVATVAQVTMITRTEEEKAGTLIRLEAGQIIEHRSIGTPIGTVITVENLFFNTPARLKFLKADSTERRHVDALITRYAMAYPHVRFSLIQDGRETFATSGTGDLADVLIEALGMDTMREMLKVKTAGLRVESPEITVYGYTSAPHVNRNTRSHITLFVNGRHIVDTHLTYAVCQAYHTLMPSDRYPIAVLMIEVAPNDVDVNVHPAKSEVRFRSPDSVFSAVQRSVRQAVVSQAPIPPVSYSYNQRERATDDDDQFSQYGQAAGKTTYRQPDQSDQFDSEVSYTNRSGQQPLELPDYDAGRLGQHRDDISHFAPSSPSYAQPYSAPQYGNYGSDDEQDFVQRSVGAPSPDLSQRPRTLPPLRVVGQIAACYIVAEGPAGMYLVDQHAAHERILYEQFMEEQRSKQVASQRTLDAETIELTPPAARLIEANIESLNGIGFEIEPFGGNRFRVRAVPTILAKRGAQESIAAILEDLESGAEPGASALEAQIILRVCKAAAVKAGQTLSFDEMQSLIRQLERCNSPRTCPHGRPTMIHMTAEQLAKEFGRT